MSLGGGLSASVGAVSDALAGDVADALPGRNLTRRKADDQTWAQQGKSRQSRTKKALRQLKQEIH